jgi:hypothetical protein
MFILSCMRLTFGKNEKSEALGLIFFSALLWD